MADRGSFPTESKMEPLTCAVQVLADPTPNEKQSVQFADFVMAYLANQQVQIRGAGFVMIGKLVIDVKVTGPDDIFTIMPPGIRDFGVSFRFSDIREIKMVRGGDGMQYRISI